MPFIYEKVLRPVPVLKCILCNKCDREINGPFATLSLSTSDSSMISTYCEDCYNSIVCSDKISPEEKELINFQEDIKMPIYEFECRNCHRIREDLIRSDKDKPVCEYCGSKKMKKIISAPGKTWKFLDSGKGR